MAPAGAAAVYALPDEVDAVSADRMLAGLRAAARTGRPVLVADLTGTVFCDSAAFRALVLARDFAQEQGTELRLAVPPGPVRRALEVTGMDRLFRLYPSLADALAPP